MLGQKGLTFDAWHYHYQNQAFTEHGKISA